MYLAQSYADFSLDVVIICLPIPLIWRQMCLSLGKKIGVRFVFLLGGLTTAASVARTVVQYGVVKEYESRNPDRTYYLSAIIYWPLIEASLGIVAARLPLLRPVGAPIKTTIIRAGRGLVGLTQVLSKDSVNSGRLSETKPEISVLAAAYEQAEKPAKPERWLQADNMSTLNDSIDRERGH